MALKPTIYRVGLQLADSDNNNYEQLTLTLARHPSETSQRLLARLLTYALRYAPELQFTRGLSTTDEPDLWLLSADGQVLHWIELGQPDDSRLRKALSRSERVSVYAYGSGTNRWWEKSAEAISALPRVEVWQLPAAEVEALGTSLVRNSQVSIAISGGVLYVDVDGNTADFAPQRLAPTR